MNRLAEARRQLSFVVNGDLYEAELVKDPVEQRRRQVKIARELRIVADFLDDHGRLTE